MAQEIFFLSVRDIILYAFCCKRYSSCHRRVFLWLGYKNIFCQRIDFHFILSQEIFFLSQEVFFLWERIVFSWCLGHLSCITFSRQICGIYGKNFLWDLKISWEPGSQVPRDYPTLVLTKILWPKILLFF